MGEQSLKSFAREIKHLIDDGRSNEAIPLAQYLLRRHPRYLLGYRLLAEAAIEQGHTRDAIEIFRRVLSADPESYVAHAGLAAAYADEDNLTEALWHMTRAFELKPDMREIRDQLRYLYELLDGRAPGRLHLNRAALAHMYMRDGLYDRAIDELRSELAGQEERVDLRTSLAEAQWHAGRRHDAVISANQVLHELPYSLKCNLIVGQFYAQDGNIDAAERCLLIARELDPENEVADRLFGEASYLKPAQVMLESMEDARQRTGQLGDPEEIAQAEWLADLSLFNDPELVEHEVDWEAIAAYESDWRTILAKATRQAIAEFKPDWRVELRSATRRVMETFAQGEPPDTLVESKATEPVEAKTVPVEPAASSRSWVQALRADFLEHFGQWQAASEAEQENVAPGDIAPAPIAAWQEALRAETDSELSRWTHEAEPSQEMDWRADLLEASGNLLEEVETPSEAPESPVESNDRLEETEAAAWKASLGEATRVALVEADGIAVPAREAGDQAIEHPGEQGDETAGQPEESEALSPHWSFTVGWTARLRAFMQEVLISYDEPGIPNQSDGAEEAAAISEITPSPAVDEGSDFVEETYSEEDLSAITAALNSEVEEELAEEAEEFWSAVTADLSQFKDWEDEEITISVPEELTGDSTTAPLVSENEAQPAEEEGLEPRARNEEETEPSRVASSVPRETVNGNASEDLDALEAARQAWQRGHPKEALAIYQRLIQEANHREEKALLAELQAWTATEDAPALAYQLLGDVYRNLGQMREAVDQYREAINRM